MLVVDRISGYSAIRFHSLVSTSGFRNLWSRGSRLPPPCDRSGAPRARAVRVPPGVRSETGLPNIRIFGLQRAFSTIHLLPDSTRALSASFRIATRQTNRISAEYPHPPTAPRPRPGTRTQSVRSPVYSVLAAAKRACSRLSSCWPFFSSL